MANLFQRVENFWEQRRAFRAAALTALRKREGLPSPCDADGNALETRFDDLGHASYHNAAGEKVERVLFQNSGKDGKPGAFAQGTRKGEQRELADAHWHSPDAGFEILEVAEDGRRLEDELADLNRDLVTFARAETVSHGQESEQAPGFEVHGTSDAELDARLQEYLKRGKQ